MPYLFGTAKLPFTRMTMRLLMPYASLATRYGTSLIEQSQAALIDMSLPGITPQTLTQDRDCLMEIICKSADFVSGYRTNR
jgi:hypothetical protein